MGEVNKMQIVNYYFEVRRTGCHLSSLFYTYSCKNQHLSSASHLGKSYKAPLLSHICC